MADLGLAGLVHMTGYLPAPTASHRLAGADIGVLPFNGGVTLKSGSLLALLAHGLPVVATRHDPLDPDLVDGHTVRLVAPRDIEGLARALLQRLAQPVVRARLGIAGRAFAGNFTWSGIAQRHFDVYQTVLGNRPITATPQPPRPGREATRWQERLAEHRTCCARRRESRHFRLFGRDIESGKSP